MDFKDGNYVFDFNKLIPMPDSLNITAGGNEAVAVACYYASLKNDEKRELDKKLKNIKCSFYGDYYKKYKKSIMEIKDNPKLIEKYNNDFGGKIDENEKKYKDLEELGKQYVDNILKYNYSSWYDWANANWGTKWNVDDEVSVIDIDNDNYEIMFNTAWSCPVGIIQEYAKICPDDDFLWEYENEDYDGYHILTKENGNIIHSVNYNKHMLEDINI